MNDISHTLIEDLFSKDIEKSPIRAGFGQGLLSAGEKHPDVWAICADLTESTNMHYFAEKFPERFIEIGVAEQNLVTVGSGLAAMGKIPFTSSYAAFSPGRNWEQIRTTIALNEQPVRIVGSHAGVSVGPDGATHQMLEDIALMRVLPNMVVIAPGDSVEAEKATIALAEDKHRPAYLRLAREATPVFTTAKTPFEIGKAYVLRQGKDISLMATGTMTYQMLVAADELEKKGLSADVIHIPSIKPLDTTTILASAVKCRMVVTAEEAQKAAGLGGAVSELISEHNPCPVLRIGMEDRFGESGDPEDLLEFFGLSGKQIAERAYKYLNENKE